MTSTTEARDNWRGIAQGSPIGSRVTYADDLVILCKKGNADQALQQLGKIMSKLKLTVKEEKTRICKVPEGELDSGYTFGRMYSASKVNRTLRGWANYF